VLRHREEHVFYRYFREVEVARAVALRPDVFGISVADERQLVSGCILAALVKEALPTTQVIMDCRCARSAGKSVWNWSFR
jgi:hypothetical protein